LTFAACRHLSGVDSYVVFPVYSGPRFDARPRLTWGRLGCDSGLNEIHVIPSELGGTHAYP
jgi:hypothetical protein